MLGIKKDNTLVVLNAFLKKIGARVSYPGLRAALKAHPDYPSLLAISDCLAQWNIPNQSYKINKETLDPNELTYPFLAHFERGGVILLWSPVF